MDLQEALIKDCSELATRKLSVSKGTAYFINFYNLPIDLVCDRAEKENNRLMFCLRQKGDKFQLEHSVNNLSRQYQLRGKTASLEKLIQYLAHFLQKVIAEVPPNYTHTKMTPI